MRTYRDHHRDSPAVSSYHDRHRGPLIPAALREISTREDEKKAKTRQFKKMKTHLELRKVFTKILEARMNLSFKMIEMLLLVQITPIFQEGATELANKELHFRTAAIAGSVH